LQITAGKLKKMLQDLGLTETEQVEIIQKFEKEELYQTIKDYREEREKAGNDEEKKEKTAELAKKLGYKKIKEDNNVEREFNKKPFKMAEDIPEGQLETESDEEDETAKMAEDLGYKS